VLHQGFLALGCGSAIGNRRRLDISTAIALGLLQVLTVHESRSSGKHSHTRMSLKVLLAYVTGSEEKLPAMLLKVALSALSVTFHLSTP
jgi:hypothetical protein